MPDEVTPQASIDPWNLLLEQTHQALSHLRAEDLEELAGRAECMLHAIAADNPARQRMPSPSHREIVKLSRARHLLGDLILATSKNLTVLQRTLGDTESRWVR